MIPGGNPTIAGPGLTPTSKALTVVAPVLVTVDPPSTPKPATVPSCTVGTTAAAATPGSPKVAAIATPSTTVKAEIRPPTRTA